MRVQNVTIRRLLLLAAVVALALYQYLGSTPGDHRAEPEAGATATWQAGQWVMVSGTVQRTLRDDNEGSRHQRFILELPQRRTLLIAHNIDLASRVPLASGDTISLRGRYEPNDRGGVIHWTHNDPQGVDRGGWIEHKGKRYH